jgi:hypothetical protein
VKALSTYFFLSIFLSLVMGFVIPYLLSCNDDLLVLTGVTLCLAIIYVAAVCGIRAYKRHYQTTGDEK